ncbi:MAG: hypothetical protein VX729_01810 [Pseudomonadota bacterium]|nr:hypothetical protein [Pseudomonadota bacterium]
MEEYTLFENVQDFGSFLNENKFNEFAAKIKLKPIDRQPQHFLDVELSNRSTETLIIALAGAYKMDIEKQLPFYIAKGFKNKVNASIAYIGDPSIYLDDVRLGWYAGDRNNHIQISLVNIFKQIIKATNARRVIFFGGSGGGFASLFYSKYFENSLSLIWNPQIFIEKYDAARFKVVDEYARAAFNCKREELSNHICSDLSEHFIENKNKNHILYMQNITDKHVQRDLIPFCEKVCLAEKFQELNFEKESTQTIDENFILHMHNWSLGHKPPPRNILLYLLSTLSEDGCQWDPTTFATVLEKCDSLALSQ